MAIFQERKPRRIPFPLEKSTTKILKLISRMRKRNGKIIFTGIDNFKKYTVINNARLRIHIEHPEKNFSLLQDRFEPTTYIVKKTF